MRRITTPIETIEYEQDALDRLQSFGFASPAALQQSIDTLKAEGIDASPLEAIMPKGETVTQDRMEIVYAIGDRIVVGNGRGQISATVSVVRDNGIYACYFDNNLKDQVDVPYSNIVKQADTGGNGKIEHADPIPNGWSRLPEVHGYIDGKGNQIEMLAPGEQLHGCPYCRCVLSEADMKEKICTKCIPPQPLTMMASVGMVAL